MRLVASIVLVLVLAVAAAGAAPAEPPPSAMREAGQAPAQTPGERSAQLELSGSGTVQLNGRLVVYGKIARGELITVKDKGGDARVFIDGERYPQRRWTVVRRTEGRFYFQGRNIQVKVRGRDMSVALAGNGKARLQGSGRFRLNGGASLSWVRPWINVKPGASPPRTSRRKKRQSPASSRSRSRRVVVAR